MDKPLVTISFNVTNGGTFQITADITPYVVIATAPSGFRTYTFIDETLTPTTDSFQGGVNYLVFTKTISGESPELNILFQREHKLALSLDSPPLGHRP